MTLSIDRTASELGVCRRTVYSRIKDGTLQTVRTMGGSQRVTKESVDHLRPVYARLVVPGRRAQ